VSVLTPFRNAAASAAHSEGRRLFKECRTSAFDPKRTFDSQSGPPASVGTPIARLTTQHDVVLHYVTCVLSCNDRQIQPITRLESMEMSRLPSNDSAIGICAIVKYAAMVKVAVAVTAACA